MWEGQLKPIHFSCFDAAKAIELLRQNILEEMKHCDRECPQKELDFCIEKTYSQGGKEVVKCGYEKRKATQGIPERLDG